MTLIELEDFIVASWHKAPKGRPNSIWGWHPAYRCGYTEVPLLGDIFPCLVRNRNG
jgi:hypothetical protein